MQHGNPSGNHLSDNSWGYGSTSVPGGNSRGMGSLGSMGSISSDNPTVQWFRANFGANLTEQEINGLITDITRAIQNGLPPEKIPQLTSLPPSAIENLYDTIAAQQGKSADSVRETYEQQRAADMAAIQGLGAGIVAGATGMGAAMAGLSATSRRQFAGLNADALMTVAEEGRNLTENTRDAGHHVSMASLGQLASPNTPDQQRQRGQGAGMMV